MNHPWINAGTLLAQVQALQDLGLFSDELRAALGDIPTDPLEKIPVEKYLKMWQIARHQYGKPGLPTALAMAVPFGAFGILDYLTASAETVAGALESLALHSRIATQDTGFEISESEGMHWISVQAQNHVPPEAQEFTLAMLVTRLRLLCGKPLCLQAVLLPGVQPQDNTLHEQLYGKNCRYQSRVAALAIDAKDLQESVVKADPYMHEMLKDIAARLMLGNDVSTNLELALKARLRDLLCQGGVTSHSMARLLGTSERTLQRRLAEAGKTFSQLVEDFQHEEALRLLSNSKASLAQIGLSLGYSEQTSFTRAFKRWTGITPSAWRKANGLHNQIT